MEQLDINIRDMEQESIRTDTRLMNEMHPFCYECGCLEKGTIEYDGEVVPCHVCNIKGEGVLTSR